jgi:hypothetical protein
MAYRFPLGVRYGGKISPIIPGGKFYDDCFFHKYNINRGYCIEF